MLVKKPKRSDHPEGLIGDTIFLEEIANYHKARAEFAEREIKIALCGEMTATPKAVLNNALKQLKDNE